MFLKKANEYLKEKLNTTVKFHTYKNAEYNQAVSTMVSSGVPMDIVFTGVGKVDFVTYAAADAFVPIEDMIDKYLPKTKAQLPKGAWDVFSYNGHVYAVPPNKDLAETYGFLANQTMIDDLGIPFPEKWDSFYELKDWIYSIKKARDEKYPDKEKNPLFAKQIAPMNQWYHYESFIGSRDTALIAVNVPNLKGFDGQGEGETVFCPFFTNEYVDYVKTIRELVKDNIVPFDPSAFDQDNVLFKKGEILGSFPAGYLFYDEDTNAPYFKSRLYPSKYVIMSTNYIRTGANAISSQSANVERALEFLEFVNNDSHLATLLRFGLEGENEGWTDKDNDGVIELGAKNMDVKNRNYYEWYGWQIGSIVVSKYAPNYPTNFGNIVKELNDNAIQDTNLGFTFIQDSVENEIAACNNVVNEYLVLTFGQTDDYEQQIELFRKKLKDNGIDRIVEEAQRQLSEWRRSVGKTVK